MQKICKRKLDWNDDVKIDVKVSWDSILSEMESFGVV